MCECVHYACMVGKKGRGRGIQTHFSHYNVDCVCGYHHIGVISVIVGASLVEHLSFGWIETVSWRDRGSKKKSKCIPNCNSFHISL